MSMKRREDPSMLTGGAKYVADLDVPGMLDVAFVRSEVAHATISNIDVEAALAVPGVVAVFTAADLVGVQPLADFLPEGSIKTPRFPLAADRVRYVGEPIVAVVAENRYVAEDAAELVVVDYNELPAVTSIADATAEGAQRVHDHVPGNTWFTQSRSFGREWAAVNNVELAYTPTYSSWLNRIEAQFQALRYFSLDGTDHASHREQASMIRRYIRWRIRNAHDRALRELVKRANVA